MRSTDDWKSAKLRSSTLNKLKDRAKIYNDEIEGVVWCPNDVIERMLEETQ